ncbi:MAG TPA: hypothetical protein VL651_05295 [Bacteroidia bacterium]|jgi:hypothetical protein|nr:hypothetical protein [Bacteroidia bacterium]
MNFIHLYYLCRDQNKHRRYSCAVFLNPLKRSEEEVEQIIREHLVDETSFDHIQWGLPSVLAGNANPDESQIYHEFIGVSATEEIPLVVATDLEEFLARVKKSKY